MGKGTKQIFQESVSKGFNSLPHNGSLHDQWVFMDADDDISNSASPATSFEGSTTSGGASSSEEDLREDAWSSSSSTLYSSPASSTQQLSKGPLYELSELMAQLPIKRGLSKHYQGKSQSFTSLSSVRCLEDLAKRENPYRKNMKPCKSYGGGLNGYKPHTPKATISKKKGSRGSFPSLLGKRSSVMGSHRLQIPVQRIQ